MELKDMSTPEQSTDRIIERPLPSLPRPSLSASKLRPKPLLKPTRFSCEFTERSAGWRPFSLQSSYLVTIAVTALAYLAAVLTLQQSSNRNHGLATFSDTQSIYPSISFAYNYVPTILAVLALIPWSFVDLDVQRLEPYFQLSNPQGTPATALFINYAFEFPFLVPFTSARRGHWVVALVSSVSILASIFLPALQSALLALGPVNLSETTQSQSWPNLVPPASQKFSPEVFYRLDSTFTLGTLLPKFTTSRFAVAPLDLSLPGSYSQEEADNVTLSADLIVYWSDLTCIEIPMHSFPSFPESRTPINDPSLDGSTTIA